MANKRFPDQTPSKSTLVVADTLLVADSEASFAAKSATITNLITLVETALSLDDKADRNNVLGFDQIAAFTPTEDYHPATKAYVDAAETAAMAYTDSELATHVADFHALSATHYADVAALSATIDSHTSDVSNPHVVTASQVGLGTAATDIVALSAAIDTNISDISTLQTTTTELQAPSAIAITSVAGALDIDVSTGRVFTLTLTEDITASFSNVTAGGRVDDVSLIVTQDSTPRTITWTNTSWNAATPPTLSTGNGDIDIFTFMLLSGSTIYGFTAGQNMG